MPHHTAHPNLPFHSCLPAATGTRTVAAEAVIQTSSTLWQLLHSLSTKQQQRTISRVDMELTYTHVSSYSCFVSARTQSKQVVNTLGSGQARKQQHQHAKQSDVQPWLVSDTRSATCQTKGIPGNMAEDANSSIQACHADSTRHAVVTPSHINQTRPATCSEHPRQSGCHLCSGAHHRCLLLQDRSSLQHTRIPRQSRNKSLLSPRPHRHTGHKARCHS